MLMGNRFNSVLDECEHIVLAVLLADVYNVQKLDLVNNYGSELVEKAYLNVATNYSSILKRLL